MLAAQAESSANLCEPSPMKRIWRPVFQVVAERLPRCVLAASARKAEEIRLREHRALLVAAAAACDIRERGPEHRCRPIVVPPGERDRPLSLKHPDVLPDVRRSACLALGVILDLGHRAIDLRRLA